MIGQQHITARRTEFGMQQLLELRQSHGREPTPPASTPGNHRAAVGARHADARSVWGQLARADSVTSWQMAIGSVTTSMPVAAERAAAV